MSELSDAHAMAIERSCAVTAVALSGQRREGVRLVTGAHREFSLNSSLDFVHVPYPSLGRDWTRRTLTCGVALQCSPSKERLADYRLNELSTRELRCPDAVEAGVGDRLGRVHAGRVCCPRCDACSPTSRYSQATSTPRRCSTVRSNWRAAGNRLTVHPLLGRLPLAYTMPQGLSDKLRRSFGRMPWTTTQKRRSAAVFGARGRRRWRPKSQSSATEQAAGQRPRRHPGAPSRHSVSRMERVDEELHAGPRRGPRARRTPVARVSRRRRRPTCGNGSRSTPTAR